MSYSDRSFASRMPRRISSSVWESIQTRLRFFPLYPGHLLHQAVNVFSLPPGIGADVYRLHVRPVQQPFTMSNCFFTEGITSYRNLSGRKGRV